MDGPTEVTDLEFSPAAQQDVLGLDVPMDDVPGVAVNQGICQLLNVLGRPESSKC